MGAYADFEARVSRMLRRGTVYDADIPQFISDARMAIENRHNWSHMWTTIDAATLTAGTRDVVLSGFIKNPLYFRFQVVSSLAVGNAKTYYYAPRKQPQDIAGQGEQNSEIFPTVYHVNSRSPTATTLRLSNTFAEDKTYDLGYYEYSVLDDNNFWLSYDQGLLLSATLVEMSPFMRDPKRMQMWAATFDRKIILAEEADLIHKYEGEQMEMTPYSGDLGEDLFDNWNDRRL